MNDLVKTKNFTVVIPSRNRPELLRVAIESVLMQTHNNVEVLVVNDGSDGDNEQVYIELSKEFTENVRFLNLEHTPNGHGPSGAINRGVAAAQGRFVTFLDDDDYWTDSGHLERAWEALKNDDSDAYYSNQSAYFEDQKVAGPLWLEGLDKIIESHDRPDSEGVYTATVADLMACNGFAHLNTSIIRRSLYTRIGGMDEAIRYECEWDLFFRTADQGENIRFHPAVVSRHNAPDPNKSVNVSTGISMLQKLLYRAYVLDKAMLFTEAPEIEKKARNHKTYTLKKMAEILAQDGRYGRAHFYARQASTSSVDLKWLLYSIYLWGRKMLKIRNKV